jgi:hypothetical protein
MAQWPGLHRHHEVFTMTTLRFEMQFSCSGEDNRRVQVFWDVKLSSGEWFLMFWGARCNHLQGSRGPWKCPEPLTQWQSIISQITYMLRNSAVRTSNLTKWELGKDRTWAFAPVRTVSYIAIWRGLLHSPREWITGFYDLLKIRPTCQLTRCHIPQDLNLQHLHCGNLQSSRRLSLLCEADHIVLSLKMQVIIQFLHTFLWCGT